MLQHRGQDSAGMVTVREEVFFLIFFAFSFSNIVEKKNPNSHSFFLFQKKKNLFS